MIKEEAHKTQTKSVLTAYELLNTNFEGNCNAICWKRNLEGNFKEITEKLQLKENITNITIDELLALKLSSQGEIAQKIILNDLKLLTDFGAMPSLNLLKNYDRDTDFDFISTDVYSYHVDRSPIPTATFLCTYYGASSDILPNEQAIKKIDVPEISIKLKEFYKGPDEKFESFLTENYFDLHYQAKPNSNPISLGLGHLWKLAVDHPNQEVLPCIHRAPIENDGELRLLLIC